MFEDLLSPEEEIYWTFVLDGGTKDIRQVKSRCISFFQNRIDVTNKSKFNFSKSECYYYAQKTISDVFHPNLTKRWIKARNRNRSLLHPIPRELQNCFVGKIDINGFYSLFLWKLKMFKNALSSLRFLIFEILDLRLLLPEKEGSMRKSEIWLSGFGDELFERHSLGNNFSHWIMEKIGCHDGEQFSRVSISKEMSFIDGLFPEIRLRNLPIDKSRRWNYWISLAKHSLHAVGDLMLGKPEMLSMGREFVLSLRIRFGDCSYLPNRIFFSDSQDIIKPLWAYSLEERGVKCYLIFFSSFESPRIESESNSNFDSYRIASWKNYWAVDEVQKNELESALASLETTVTISGYPNRTDAFFDFQRDHQPSIAIFDYESHRGYFGYSTLNDFNYFASIKDLWFLEKIVRIASDLGVYTFHKPKRVIASSKRNPDYQELLYQLQSNPLFIMVPPAVSVERLLVNTIASISMPVTSTAQIARSLSKPAVYFDPLGSFPTNDPSLRGVTVLKSESDLKVWLQSNVLT